jgi:lipopolysaccharide transport system ATP-binding protein
MEVIRIENLSKLYDLGQVGTGTISKDLNRWWASVRGKEDPYSKIGQVNDRTKKAGKDDSVWALKDINFSVKQGEVVGIIGRNGAGKSTLLKIISRITTPTTGAVKVKGRIASLLEVGTGFHPEMTGRENIFMNGTLLGMRRAEIQSKLDEIIDFAGVEMYIDTPVKRYSSGMQVRLGFAVAAFLEPEILIVDEVLAVGDAEFQKKAIGRMQDVSKGDGRTILFVSHNLAAIKSLCTKSCVLDKGFSVFTGETASAVAHYLNGKPEAQNKVKFESRYDYEFFTLHEIIINPKDETFEVPLNEYHEIEINTFLTIKKNVERLHYTYVLNNENGEALFTFSHVGIKSLKLGYNHLKCTLPKGFLNIGTYYLTAYLIEDAKRGIFVEKDIISISVQEGPRTLGGWMGKEPGFIKPVFDWEIL